MRPLRPLLTILLLAASALAQNVNFYQTKITPKLSGCCRHEDWGINDTGAVTGVSTAKVNMVNVPHAILWSPALGLKDLGFPTLGTAVNNTGEVVGSSTGQFMGGDGFVWDGADTTIFGHARAINNHNVVVGDAQAGAFQWDNVNGQIDLGWGANSVAYGINDAGTIVGCKFIAGVSHAVVDGNDIQNFGYESCATAISPNGTVTGWVHAGDGGHGFLWHPGDVVMTDMGTAYNGGGVTPTGINDRGTVVGTSSDFGAFLWTESTGYRDLNALSGNKPRTMVLATGINAWGQIVTKERRVLTPVVHMAVTSDSDLTHVPVGQPVTFTVYSWITEGPVDDATTIQFKVGTRIMATAHPSGGFANFQYTFPAPGYPYSVSAVAVKRGPYAQSSVRTPVYVYPQ